MLSNPTGGRVDGGRKNREEKQVTIANLDLPICLANWGLKVTFSPLARSTKCLEW